MKVWLLDCSARINLIMLTRDCYAKEKREEKFCLSSLPEQAGTVQAPEPALNLRAPAKKAKSPCGFYKAISLVLLGLF